MFAFSKSFGILLLFGFSLFSMAGGGKPHLVIEPCTYLPGLEVRAALKKECAPHNAIVNGVKKRAEKRLYQRGIQDSAKKGDHHVLSIEIVDIFGNGGGMYSGAKKIVLRGMLRDKNGEVMGTFYASRHSIGNFLVLGLQGTCQIMAKVEKKLSKDIVKWLKAPTMDALLGNPENAKIVKDLIDQGAWPRSGTAE